MSRLLVKNLPSYMSQEKLKTHFTHSNTEITDCKLLTKHGNSRRFAFIGYKTDLQAQEIINHYNNSFIDTLKISVEIAHTINPNTNPLNTLDNTLDNNTLNIDIKRPWSKYSKGSSAYNALNATQSNYHSKTEIVQTKDIHINDVKEDPVLDEFMAVMSKDKSWGNDFKVKGNVDLQDYKSDHLNEYQDLSMVRMANEHAYTLIDKKKELFSSDEKMNEIMDESMNEIMDESMNESMNDESMNESNTESKVAMDPKVSDLDYLKSKISIPIAAAEVMKVDPGRLALLQESGVLGEIINQVQAIIPSIPSIHTPSLVIAESDEKHSQNPSPEMIADTGRIMIRNLPYSCTHEDLTIKFGVYGNLVEVHLPSDKLTLQSKGYAFILFMMPDDAVKAFTELDGSIFQGRILEIVAAKDRPSDRNPNDESHDKKGYKSIKEVEQRASAGNEFNWNSLFMNSNAVADAISRQLGIQKNQVFDPSTEDMAVRLALAETQIINETKEYLEEQGVDLKNSGKRSSNVILIKNIPSATTEQDISDTFGVYGDIGRIILPPARTLALIEFPDRNVAKVAFRKLAYTKFKNLPLFLEWAPEHTFVEGFDQAKADLIKADRADALIKRIKDNDDDSTPTATVFVKNLNFETVDAGLKDAFEAVGGLRSVRISTKLHKSVRQSMGFGFLEFNSTEDAKRCIKTMQKFNLDGHELLLKYSNPTMKPASQSRKRVIEEGEGTKLIVRNLPFEATKKDLKQLFNPFGQLKTVRVPKKFDGTHRGFAFVDFLTHEEAKTVISKLGDTHLYGRHLVLEWAKESESVEEIRERTGRSFGQIEKKTKVSMIDDEDEPY